MKRIKPGMTAIVVLAGALVGAEAAAAPATAKAGFDCESLGQFTANVLNPKLTGEPRDTLVPPIPDALLEAAKKDGDLKDLEVTHKALGKSIAEMDKADVARHKNSDRDKQEALEKDYDKCVDTRYAFEDSLRVRLLQKINKHGCEKALTRNLIINSAGTIVAIDVKNYRIHKGLNERIRQLEAASQRALTALEACRSKDSSVASKGSKSLEALDAAINALSEASSAKAAPSKGDLSF